MKIGLCMSVIGGGGGNDTIFYSLKRYFETNGHAVAIFSNIVEKKSLVNLPKFGLFRQLQKIEDYNKNIHKQDLLISLTGIPPKTKVPIIYYHQQLPSFAYKNNEIPEKYRKGLWKLYYDIFRLIANYKSTYLINKNISHFCVSLYLQERLESQMGIVANLLYPAIDNIDNTLSKRKEIITVCRISPEKNLAFNIRILKGFNYNIVGSNNIYAYYYIKELEKQLDFNHKLITNISRIKILDMLSKSKVYFSSSKETLGLSVLESISAGCIPVVIDNTGNKENVPFPELRFTNDEEAKEKVSKALNNEYDYLLPELRKHLEKFTTKNYDRLLNLCKINEVIIND